MREEVFLLGRILMSLVFLGSGVGHLTQTEGSAQYAAFKKVPSPKLAVQASGVLMILGAVAILAAVMYSLGDYPRLLHHLRNAWLRAYPVAAAALAGALAWVTGAFFTAAARAGRSGPKRS